MTSTHFGLVALLLSLVMSFGLCGHPNLAAEQLPSLVTLTYPEVRSSSASIVGGENATLGELPYQLYLKYFDNQFCGASLIKVKGRQLAVTAAHCLHGTHLSLSNLKVVAGDIDLKNINSQEQIRKVIAVIIHEDFDDRTLENDIALIMMTKPFKLNSYVKPIKLPKKGKVIKGKVTVSGFGNVAHGGKSSNVLKKVVVPVVDDLSCQRSYRNIKIVTESMLCAGVPEGGKDSCQGDSGGPLKSDKGYLAGIVSHGYGCAFEGYAGIYTEVSYFVDWIENNVK